MGYNTIIHQQIIHRPDIFSAGRAEGQSPVLPRRRGRRRAAAGGGRAGGGRRLRQLWRGKMAWTARTAWTWGVGVKVLVHIYIYIHILNICIYIYTNSICIYMFIYVHICSYMFIYVHLCSYMIIYVHIWSYMFIWRYFFHILGIVTPTDFHIFQRGKKNQPVYICSYDLFCTINWM